MVSGWLRGGALILGIACLVFAGTGVYGLATAPPAGASYAIATVEPVEDTPPTTKVITYSQLPPAAQASFDGAQQDGTVVAVYESEDPEAVRSILAHRYVQKDGRYFEYSVIHGDNTYPRSHTVLVLTLSGLSGLVLVSYGLEKRDGD
ncbi:MULTISPECIES: hypothetical protein [unclassified Haladaptatus]|uniref:hypothetical protein n=1 Tax=unclassified Haladaptatus TaxID=2622732 RepID=UPI0023E7FEBC|nr:MULTISPECIES: hypothetical protein [unclassified Haladaptatus]